MNVPLGPAVPWNSTFSRMIIRVIKIAWYGDVFETTGITEFLVAEKKISNIHKQLQNVCVSAVDKGTVTRSS